MHEKIKQLEAECKTLRIQHILYRSISKGNAADNIQRAVSDSVKKMTQAQ
jgi:hypothetical protein